MSVFEVDVVQTTGTWEFLIDQGVWELEVITGPRGPIYVAGDPIAHGTLTGRNDANQHTSDAITVGAQTLTAYLTTMIGSTVRVDFLLAVAATDGTNTSWDLLQPSAEATASGEVPAEWVSALHVDMPGAFFAGGFTDFAPTDTVTILVPGGAQVGVWQFTPATIEDPWTEITGKSIAYLPGTTGNGFAHIWQGVWNVDRWMSVDTFAYGGQGLLLGITNAHSALNQFENILDRFQTVSAWCLTTNIDITDVNPTMESGELVAGARFFLNAQTNPSENGTYYVSSGAGPTWTYAKELDVYDPPGNGYVTILSAPGDPAHCTMLMWVDDDPTNYFRAGAFQQAPVSGEWRMIYDPTASTTVTTSDITGVATARILGRTTAGTGTAEELTASDVRTLLGLIIGTDVQAYDAELAAIAGLTSAANKFPYFTGSGTAALADMSRIPTTVAVSGSDVAVTSSTTLVDITGLSFSVVSGTTYYIDAWLQVTGDSAGDLRLAATCPTGTLALGVAGVGQASSSIGQAAVTTDAVITASATPVTLLGTVTGSTGAVWVKGYFAATANGTFQLQHAQRISNGTATTVKIGSYLTYHT